MSVENWKLEKDLCRCCLSEGTFQNLAEPCTNQGAEEIYSDMLIEGLDVNLTPVSGPLCTSTYTICEECILRLRDACSFKRQVLLSEKRFRELYSKDIIQCHSSVKKEAPDSDNEEGPVKQEMIEDDDDFRQYDDDDGDLKCEVEEEIQEVKKAKTKKPKAKEKTKPKKRLGRPRKPPGGPEAEPEAEPDGDPAGTNDNKDVSIVGLKPDYSSVEDRSKKYDCNKCNTVYKSLSRLKRHIHDRHNETKTNCDKIEIEIDVKIENQDEERLEQEKISCDVCQKRVGVKNMPKHLRTHGPFKCPECSIQLLTAKELTAHKRNTHNHICEICDMKTSCQNRMAKHLRSHGIFKCFECSSTFPQKLELKAHEKKHIRKHYAHLICSVCSANCRDAKSLAFHKHEVHGDAIPTCGVCGYKTWQTGQLHRHQRKVHMKEKNVSCSQCSLGFYDNTALTRHMIRHAPVKKHECPHCLKRFPRRSTMMMHLKIHTGDKKKVCPLCDAKFVQRASLTYHMAKHHPESVSLLD